MNTQRKQIMTRAWSIYNADRRANGYASSREGFALALKAAWMEVQHPAMALYASLSSVRRMRQARRVAVVPFFLASEYRVAA